LASPTVLAELHEQSVNSTTSRKRDLARIVLANILAWDVIPLHLSAVETAIAERLANRFLELRLLPQDECNDALILAEAALAKAPLLVTSDKHFLDMDEDALALAFSDADLPAAHPVHPKALLRAMR
jgi:predicted nucleic acid-binding protein